MKNPHFQPSVSTKSDEYVGWFSVPFVSLTDKEIDNQLRNRTEKVLFPE